MSDVNATLPEVEVTAKRDPPAAPATASKPRWLRIWNLTVGQPGAGATTPSGQSAIDVGSSSASKTQEGTALNLSDFHFTFRLSQTTGAMPWQLEATVWNVPLTLAKQIADQYTDVALTVGYKSDEVKNDNTTATISHDEQGLPVGERSDEQAAAVSQNKSGGQLLFTGPIIWFEKGRENATDTFLRIYANQFDKEHNASVVNTSLQAKYTQKDVIQACIDAMNLVPSTQGVSVALGVLTDGLEDTKSPRGRTLYGMPRDILRDVAQSCGGHWHIDDQGKLNLVKITDPPRGTTVTINSDTGMVGVPHMNMDGGVTVRMLLDPSIKPGSSLKLNQGDITTKQLSQGVEAGGGALPEEAKQVKFASDFFKQADGQYIVWTVEHYGDTRGNPWYTEATTRGAVPTISTIPNK